MALNWVLCPDLRSVQMEKFLKSPTKHDGVFWEFGGRNILTAIDIGRHRIGSMMGRILGYPLAFLVQVLGHGTLSRQDGVDIRNLMFMKGLDNGPRWLHSNIYLSLCVGSRQAIHMFNRPESHSRG